MAVRAAFRRRRIKGHDILNGLFEFNARTVCAGSLRWVLAGAITLALLSDARAQAPQSDTPRYVIYYNSDASPASSLLGTPYTHVILSFITLAPGASPDAPVALVVPDKLGPALQVIPQLQAEGKKVLISFGGGNMERAAYAGAVGRIEAVAGEIANFATRHRFDGVDIDFEVSAALETDRPVEIFDGRAFLIELTRALHGRLPEDALLTHVPQAPYLDPDWHGGPYLEVLRETGDMIDWITVQYYNNPDFDAPVRKHIVGEGPNPAAWSYTGITSGLSGIAWPTQRTLVGLPVYRGDAANGHIVPEKVVSEIVCPLRLRFGRAFGGLTGWQFSTLTSDHKFWNTKLGPSVVGPACKGDVDRK